jgi:hypothetical protein
MTDPSGLWGEIERHGGDRAVVCSNDVNDSWTSLAVKSGFSSSDWPKWVATLDNGPLPTKPELNKKYTIPNVIYFARGHDFNNDPAKQRAIYDTWQASMDPYEFIYQALGFKVTENDDILKFIQDPNIYGFMFVGHGTGDNEKPFFGSIVLNTPNPALAKKWAAPSSRGSEKLGTMARRCVSTSQIGSGTFGGVPHVGRRLGNLGVGKWNFCRI